MSDMILRLDVVRRMLKDRQVHKIAEATGISRFTIYRVRDGHEAKYETIEKLSDYLMENK
jgi:uncharacterized protein YerC